MNWEKLFAPHILNRGYQYYLENAVGNMTVSDDCIKAEVYGTYDYEVEITLNNNTVTDMYCSCPYAEDGNYCKHMAAVLYECFEVEFEEENAEVEDNNSADLFCNPCTKDEYDKKYEMIKNLVKEADIETVQACLITILCDDEKQLVRFNNMLHKSVTGEDVERYISQVDSITKRYLGRDNFINYYDADGFILEMEDILDRDVRNMIDNGSYMSAFKLMNYIFTLMGDVDMDDSDGGTSIIANQIYRLWLELLNVVEFDDKQTMFQWFVTHLDGSIIDYLEDYIENITIEEFQEKQFNQAKMRLIEDKLQKATLSESDWTREYIIGKWAVKYLKLLEKKKVSIKQIKEFCDEYWENSSVRGYYIGLCLKDKEYDKALDVINESIEKDKEYRGLLSDYSKKKMEIYQLQGDKKSYIEELWKFELEYNPGNLEIFRELKKQYQPEDWKLKREIIFKKIPKYGHVDVLYKEEKLYDLLLEYVIKQPGLYKLQEYENVLIKEYKEQILKNIRKK